MVEAVLLNQRYRLDMRLGAGGMAMVYRARDLTLERDVAVKILRESYSKDAGFRERFHHEAKAAGNLSHPNIVTVHDFGYDAGRLFIVMEYINGIDLKTILIRRNKLQIKDTLKLIIQACAGVGYAHRAGLVHCDIKPQNFIITPDNRLKVTDFGIARALATIRPDEKSDIVWGSPQYFSPEQASGNPPSPASDVYSLGIVMYEMLTGNLPFNGATPEELARMHREDPPPPPSKENPAIPSTLEQILLKILSKEPSARYRTADQLGRVLINYMKQANTWTNDTSIEPLNTSVASLGVGISPSPSARLQQRNSAELISQWNLSLSDKKEQVPAIKKNPLDIDWITIFLALIALITVGGLIPFWMWIYFLYRR